jgi:hypothetical protein
MARQPDALTEFDYLESIKACLSREVLCWGIF